jgi:hypothetical protein
MIMRLQDPDSTGPLVVLSPLKLFPAHPQKRLVSQVTFTPGLVAGAATAEGPKRSVAPRVTAETSAAPSRGRIDLCMFESLGGPFLSFLKKGCTPHSSMSLRVSAQVFSLCALSAEVARGEAVGAAEGLAEVGGAGEPPPGGDRVDRAGGQLGVGEVASALLQAALADPAGDGAFFLLEELVQVAQGDVVGRGDRVRAQVRVAEVVSDERRFGCRRLGLRLDRQPGGSAGRRTPPHPDILRHSHLLGSRLPRPQPALGVLGHDTGDSRLIGGWPPSAVCRIGARAERKVTGQLVNAFKKVSGKENILFKLAVGVAHRTGGHGP